MTNGKLSEIAASLLEEERRLTDARETVKTQLRSLDEELKKVRAASATLSESKRKKSRSPSKPAPSKEVVSKLVGKLRSSKPTIDRTQLKLLVEEALKSNGYSLAGFALRFNETVADLAFPSEFDNASKKENCNDA